MKKSLFAICAIAACFASCSKVVESDSLGTPISFDPYVGKTAITKASVITAGDLESTETAVGTGVRVNAFIHNAVEANTVAPDFLANFMENQLVEVPSGNYAPARYWPAADKQIDFVSWVPVKNASVSESDKSVLDFTVPVAVKDQVDLLVSEPSLNKNGSTSEDDKVVALKFKHLLSRIRFEIEGNQLPTDGVNVVTLSELSLNGKFASSGTVNMRAKGADLKVAAGTEFTQKYELTGEHFENVPAGASADATDLEGNVLQNGINRTKADSYIMLIPDQNDPDHIILSYTVTTYKIASWKEENNKQVPVLEMKDGKPVIDGTPVVNTAKFDLRKTGSGDNANDFAFEAGKAYVYKFSITMDTISFTVEVEDWVTATTNPEAEDDIEDNYPKTEQNNPAQGA